METIGRATDRSRYGTTTARFPFRGRKRLELDVWARAVAAWSGTGDTRRASMGASKAEIEALRRFSPNRYAKSPAPSSPLALRGYISGFQMAEGHLRLTRDEIRATVQLRADDLPLLRMLASETGMGRVRIYRPTAPLNPVALWTIAARRDCAALASSLEDARLPGRKGKIARLWSDGIHARLGGDRTALEAAVEALGRTRTYTAAAEGRLLELPRRDIREACETALVAYAERAPGPLSCAAYTRWRSTVPGAPTRNTIARQFGSWHAALDAVGLADRAARPPQRIGGVGARERRRREQRERVVAAVRECERQLGRIPRAMEFFRWRLEFAPDTPTQGTVYLLFQGGWSEVQDAVAAGTGAA
jgi:hypothetical protein